MKILISESQLNRIVRESLPISVGKEYSRIPRNDNAEKYISVFFENLLKNNPDSFGSKRKERIYIPFISNPLSFQISQELEKYNFKLHDYSKGVAKDKYDREVNIGKILKKIGRDDLLNNFNIDKNGRLSNKNEDTQYIVISRHPYDIAGMSTDRGWVSCMNLEDGCNRSYISKDINLGTLVVYLVHKDDLNINNPIGRVLLKPYQNEESLLYGVSRVYGNPPLDFKETVEKIVEKSNAGTSGIYRFSNEIYDDDDPTKILFPNFQLTPEIIENIPTYDIKEILEYSKDPDKITDLFLSNQKFIENLDLDDVGMFFQYSKDPEKILKKLGDKGVLFIENSSPQSFYKLIRGIRNPDKIINLFLLNQTFIENLDLETIRYIMEYTHSPERVMKILGNKGQVFLGRMDSNELRYLLEYSADTEKIINIVLSNQKFIENLNMAGTGYLFRYSINPEKIMKILGPKGDFFLKNIDPAELQGFLRRSRNKEGMIRLFLSKKEFVDRLGYEAIYLIRLSNDPKNTEWILAVYGIF